MVSQIKHVFSGWVTHSLPPGLDDLCYTVGLLGLIMKQITICSKGPISLMNCGGSRAHPQSYDNEQQVAQISSVKP